MLGNKPWDTSAGVLISREAGARVLDHDGSEHSRQFQSTIAVTPALEVEPMAAVQAALAESGWPCGCSVPTAAGSPSKCR
jgi:myo-inositol-1(or 4)-monophosphatase